MYNRILTLTSQEDISSKHKNFQRNEEASFSLFRQTGQC